MLNQPASVGPAKSNLKWGIIAGDGVVYECGEVQNATIIIQTLETVVSNFYLIIIRILHALINLCITTQYIMIEVIENTVIESPSNIIYGTTFRGHKYPRHPHTSPRNAGIHVNYSTSKFTTYMLVPIYRGYYHYYHDSSHSSTRKYLKIGYICSVDNFCNF